MGHEDGGISGWDIRINNTATERPAVRLRHATGSKRIRGLSSMPVSELLCSGSSDGIIKVWDARMLTTSSGGYDGSDDAGSSCVAEAHSRARISCLAVGVSSPSVHPPRRTKREPGGVVDGDPSKGERRSKKKEEEEEDTAYDDGYDMLNGDEDVDDVDDEDDIEDDDEGRRRQSSDALRGSIVSKRAFDKSKTRLKRRLRLRSSLMKAVSVRLEGGTRVNSASPGFRSLP